MSTGARTARLDRTRIVIAAVALADRDGLDAASMRAVAEELDVTPMALYKHVGNRAELTDEMLDRVLGEIPLTPSTTHWADTLRLRILAARRVLADHPWARDAIETRTEASPTVLAYMDALISAMLDGGLSADLVHHAMHTLSTRMWGFTRDVLPTPRLPADPGERASAMAAFSVDYPAIVRMATTTPHAGDACDDEAEFTFALDLILDGIARLHESGWTRIASSTTAP